MRFRRGFYLGDGTGAGKGRQVAGVVLDNWLKGRRKALWISKSDKLLEDAQRDWAALGQEKLQIVPQSRFKQGAPIKLAEGILFTTYATLRSDERQGRDGALKASRLTQIIDWLGADFDGVIVFDEAHALANAVGDKGERGEKAASQQGRAGLRLQNALPDARVLYVSATGATTVANLAYAARLGPLGLDGHALRDAAGICRGDGGGRHRRHGGAGARSQGARPLYVARAFLRRRRGRDAGAPALAGANPHLRRLRRRLRDHPQQSDRGAWKPPTSPARAAGPITATPRAAARSAFESNKQRFFNHLITAMKVPSLIASIEAGFARRGTPP